MNIYYDENMPFAAEFFSEFGRATAFSGRNVTAQEISDADVLLVRSITNVNESLLSNNENVQFVGTATIGVNHIDQSYLAGRQANFSSAPGCNAISVADYVLSSLVVLSDRYLFSLRDKTVGIVGAGNTGTRLSEKLAAFGISFKLCDPILEASQDDTREFSSLEEVLACDIVSLHVPLTKEGEHKTFHLLDEQRLRSLSEDQILINACRGEVIDNQALLAMKKAGHQLKLVLDVWENEPRILRELVEYTELATAHIAGYSLEGKARGTEMLYRALCKQLEIVPSKSITDYLPQPDFSRIEICQEIDEKVLKQLVKIVYDVRRDDSIFRQQLDSHGFDYIRKTYPARREFSSLFVDVKNEANATVPQALGFRV